MGGGRGRLSPGHWGPVPWVRWGPCPLLYDGSRPTEGGARLLCPPRVAAAPGLGSPAPKPLLRGFFSPAWWLPCGALFGRRCGLLGLVWAGLSGRARPRSAQVWARSLRGGTRGPAAWQPVVAAGCGCCCGCSCRTRIECYTVLRTSDQPHILFRAHQPTLSRDTCTAERHNVLATPPPPNVLSEPRHCLHKVLALH